MDRFTRMFLLEVTNFTYTDPQDKSPSVFLLSSVISLPCGLQAHRTTVNSSHPSSYFTATLLRKYFPIHQELSFCLYWSGEHLLVLWKLTQRSSLPESFPFFLLCMTWLFHVTSLVYLSHQNELVSLHLSSVESRS